MNTQRDILTSYRRPTSNIVNLEDVMFDHIFSFLPPVTDLINLSRCSKTLQSIVFSSNIWVKDPVDLCLIENCFGCGRIKVSKLVAQQIMRETDLTFLRLHSSFEDVPKCLLSLTPKAKIKRLHLRISSNPRSKLTLSSKISKLQLENLTIFGWPSHEPSIPSLHLFQLVGQSLQSLKLMESAPRDIFEAIEVHCHQLTSLVVEGVHLSIDSFQQFTSQRLKYLHLHETNIKLYGKLSLHNLEQFEMINKNDFVPSDEPTIQSLISSIPKQVKEINLFIDGYFANESIIFISQNLFDLQALTLRFRDRINNLPPDIYAKTTEEFVKNCRNIRSLQFLSSIVNFESESFLNLAKLPHLRSIKLLYQDEIIEVLPTFLTDANYLEEVIFYENSYLLESSDENSGENSGQTRWEIMEDRLQNISEQFPLVRISLGDSWWN